MKQTTLSVALEVKPASAAGTRLADRPVCTIAAGGCDARRSDFAWFIKACLPSISCR